MLETQILHNRHLLFSLVARDIKLKYVGSSLGVFWSVVQPLILLILYIIVFSTLMGTARILLKNNEVNYAVFLCPCLLAWNWFTESVSSSCYSIISGAPLIRRVAFPTGILPCVPILSGFLPFVVVLIIFFLYQGIFTPTFKPIELLLVLPVICVQFFLTIGLCFFVSALNVVIRDTAQVTMALLQILFWATPIVYMEDILVKQFACVATWFMINPFAHLMKIWREAIGAHCLPNWQSTTILLLWAIIFYIAGRYLFTKSSDSFIEQV